MNPCATRSERANLCGMRLYNRNGVWYVRQGRSGWKSLGTKDKKMAEAVLKRLEKEDLEGRLFQLDKNERITLVQWKEEYLAGRGHLSPSTTRQDELALRSLGDVIGHNIPLKAIVKAKLDEFTRILLARGVSKPGLNSYLRHIRAALNAAQEAGYLEKPVKVKAIKAGEPLPQVLSPDQIKAVIERASEDHPLLARIISFAVWTGCRRGEIIGLRWEQVKGDMAHVTGKGQKERLVPLAQGALDSMGPPQHIGLVFPKPNSNTDMEGFISKGFKRVVFALGLPENLHFHSLRHSAATHMLASGLPLPTVQKILGHAAISTTQIYAQVLEGTLREQIKVFKIG